MIWPSKSDRETFEIAGFIDAYARLPEKRCLTVVSRGEKPDYVVRCNGDGQEFGVELTSVYLSDRSVPDEHIPGLAGPPGIVDLPFIRADHERYKLRLVEAVQEKTKKARSGYNTSRPLILSVYASEYTSLFLMREELETLVKAHEPVFDTMAPFSEVVFWSLPNGGVFRVRPS